MKYEVEKWKEVVGYEGLYLISNFGRMYSVRSSKIMKTPIHKVKGYYYVSLTDINSKVRVAFIHVLVTEAFIGKRPEGKLVGHIDQNKLNNYVGNLEYCTSAKNIQDAAEFHCHKREHYKLNWIMVNEMRSLFLEGYSISELEHKYRISNSMAYKVCHNTKWKDPDYNPEGY